MFSSSKCVSIRHQKLLNTLTTLRSLESLDLSTLVCLGNSKPDMGKPYLQFKPVSICTLTSTSAHMHGRMAGFAQCPRRKESYSNPRLVLLKRKQSQTNYAFIVKVSKIWLSYPRSTKSTNYCITNITDWNAQIYVKYFNRKHCTSSSRDIACSYIIWVYNKDAK